MKKKSVEERLIASMEEAVGIAKGSKRAARAYTLTARDATARPAEQFASDRIAGIRDRLRLSQPVFARALNVSAETVRAWEQGKKRPAGPSLRLLELAEDHPEWVLASVKRRARKAERE